jgi:hypothetical protein
MSIFGCLIAREKRATWEKLKFRFAQKINLNRYAYTFTLAARIFST